ncbi:MAG: hypothetical protein P8Z68_00020 [Kineosporiaceae bacterium]
MTTTQKPVRQVRLGMILYLAVTDLTTGLSAIDTVLAHQHPLGKALRPAAIVAVAEPDPGDNPGPTAR